ncbi:unnamed protein product [Rotaria sp. Silwood1]|nr:unnamed protein product [Rotaria sp. Silwood1]CAF3720593.1 unnamed protein product [Rotaria sp. Silwood1]CAF4600891.1 unnamed protein product [Rotaria sp. Silwood1]
MNKLVIFTAFVSCFEVDSSARGHFGEEYHKDGGDHFSSGGDINRWASKLCANSSLVQSFLNQTRALIIQLNSNDSFAQVLQQKTQKIAYIESDTNAALLSSNCTQYFNGLAAVRNADMQT